MLNLTTSLRNALALLIAWFVTHRVHLRFAVLLVVLFLAVFGLFTPQLRTFAEEMGGGGH